MKLDDKAQYKYLYDKYKPQVPKDGVYFTHVWV